MTPEETLGRLGGLHDSLAGAVGPSTLTCLICLRQERPTQMDMARYFRSGWPKCCGYTMSLDRLSGSAQPKEGE